VRVEVIGNYKIGQEPWRLIEVRLLDVPLAFDFAAIALPSPGLPRENWQVPYDERVLGMDESERTLHACFFMYVLNDEALRTPAGEIALPPPNEIPRRLAHIVFEAP
jgi:hypothetical protein